MALEGHREPPPAHSSRSLRPVRHTHLPRPSQGLPDAPHLGTSSWLTLSLLPQKDISPRTAVQRSKWFEQGFSGWGQIGALRSGPLEGPLFVRRKGPLGTPWRKAESAEDVMSLTIRCCGLLGFFQWLLRRQDQDKRLTQY